MTTREDREAAIRLSCLFDEAGDPSRRSLTDAPEPAETPDPRDARIAALEAALGASEDLAEDRRVRQHRAEKQRDTYAAGVRRAHDALEWWFGADPARVQCGCDTERPGDALATLKGFV